LETVKVKDHLIICGWNQHTEEVLVTAIKSPGLPRLISGMLSLGDTNKFWRVEIPKSLLSVRLSEISPPTTGRNIMPF
jgi:hypothetical protein